MSTETIPASGLATVGGTLTGPLLLSVGSGTTTVRAGGTYAKFVSGAGVGNGADLTNDALWTLTAIPLNTFTANGDALILTLSLAAGATANNKAMGLTVGGTSITTPVFIVNGVSFVTTATITRVDSTHVNVFLSGTPSGGTNVPPVSSVNLVVADLTANTLAVVVTGASPTTGAAGDVKLFSGVAEFKI